MSAPPPETALPEPAPAGRVPAQRIVSLVPAATETLFALGVGDRVQAVSHACDHPPEVTGLPEATRLRIDVDGSSREIDEAVRSAQSEGTSPFAVLGEVLHHAQPDLIVTQQACDVCGITPTDVQATLARIEPVDRPEVLALHPHTLEDVIEDIVRLAEAADVEERGRKLLTELRSRVQDVEELAGRADRDPTVLALDWTDPPMAAGHWIPDMIEIAGGQSALLEDHEPSRYVDWSEVLDADPDVLVVAPCGFGVETSIEQASALAESKGFDSLAAAQQERIFALDADAYTSRPGPRLVDGLEQLACAIQGQPAGKRWPEQAKRIRRLD